MKKIILGIIVLISTYVSSQTYTAELYYYHGSSDRCHRGVFEWNFKGDNKSIDTYQVGNTYNATSKTVTYTAIPNYSSFELYHYERCIASVDDPAGCNYTSTDTKTASQLILGERLGDKSCNGGVTVSYFIPNLSLTPGSISNQGVVCASEQLIMYANPRNFPTEAYNWQYSTDGSKWNNFPMSFDDPTQADATIEQILGANHEDFFDKKIWFRLGISGRAFSDSYSVVYSPCAPIVNKVEPRQTSCYTITDGGFKVEFDRGIGANDRLNFNLYILESNDSEGPEILPQVVGTSNQIKLIDGKYIFDWPNNLAPGKYRFRYQLNMSGGISKDNDLEITSPSEITYTVTKSDPLCPSGNGSIVISDVKGGNDSGLYSYKIDDGNWVEFSGKSITIPRPPKTSADNPKNAKPYTVNVRDYKGCLSTAIDVVVDIGPDPIIIEKTVGHITYNGANNGAIRVTVKGDTDPYTYEWTDLSGTYTNSNKDIESLFPGKYTLTVTDKNGCKSKMEDIEIKVPPVLAFNTILVTSIDCSDRTNGIITATATGGFEEIGGNAEYTFELLKENSLGVYSVVGSSLKKQTLKDFVFSEKQLSEGNYKIRLTENISSRSKTNIIVSEVKQLIKPDPIAFTITNTSHIACKGEATGTATVNITGGSGSYITEWYKDGITLYSAAQNPTNLEAGTYVLVVKEANIQENSSDCFADISISNGEINITEPIEEVGITTIRLISPTAGNADGSIVVEAIGGVPPYTYLWNTGSTLPTITNIADGNYTVEVTDANNCTIIKEYIVEELSVTITITPGEELLCHGQLEGLTANPVGGDKQYTYAWYNENDLTTVLGTEKTIRGLPEGNYIVSVIDNNGAGTLVTSPLHIITEPELLEYEVVTTPVSCYQGNDGTLTINAKGGTGTLQYSIDNGVNYRLSNSFTGLSGNTYTIKVKDANDCTQQGDHLVYTPDPIEVTPTITDVGIFGENTGEIILNVKGGNGGFTYSWTGPNGFAAAIKDIKDLYIGEYTVVIKDVNFENATDNQGCTITHTYTITQPDRLEVTMGYETFDSDLKCFGDDNARLLATVTGGVAPYTYIWLKETTLGNFETLPDNSSLFMGADAGTFRVDIEDVNGAQTSSDLFLVSQPDDLVVEVLTTNIICYGDASGAIDLTISGGIPPYTIAWENGETTKERTNLLAAIYKVEVRDANACLVKKDIEVKHLYEDLQIASVGVYDVTIFDGNDGALSVNITGGATPYIITWTRTADNNVIGNTAAITELRADEYKVVIIDAEGCRIEQTYTIAEPDIIIPTLVHPVCIGDCNGSITVEVDYLGSYTYLWSTGETTNTITNLCKGTYSVTIEGFGNRILERTYVLNDPDPLDIDLGDDKTLCWGQTYTIDATVANTIATYLWQSDNGFDASTAQVELSESGIYTVFVTDEKGCVSSKSIQVFTVDDSIVSDFAVSSDLYVNESFVMVDLSNPIPDRLEWMLPEEAVIVENSQKHAEIKFEKTGEYEIGLRTHIGDCEEYTFKKIVIRERSFNENEQFSEEVKEYLLYPNPTSGNFTISLVFDVAMPIDIKLFSVTNNKVLKRFQGTGNSEYSIPFNLQGELPSGIYFLMLEIPGKSYVRKIIIE